MFDTLRQDLKYGLRLMWKDKSFSLTAVATLSLCIGANAVIFSFIHSVLFKPLPFPQADRLITIFNSYPNVGVKRASNSGPDFYDRRRALTACEDVAVYQTQGMTIGESGSVQQVQGMNVSPSFFRLLRTQPILGRIFTEDEGEEGNEKRAILSYELWQELYGGDRSVIGKNLRIYGNPFQIVGVLPKNFQFVDPKVRLWRPIAFTPRQRIARHSNSWDMFGRLKPGATLEQVRSQLQTLNAANLDLTPDLKPLLLNAGFHTEAYDLESDLVREVRGALYFLWGAALLVLLIGAVNIANLILARSTIRAKELATRLAMGAGRWRVAAQLITENTLVTLLSALVGLLLGFWSLRLLRSFALEFIPRGSEIALDWKVVLFIIALATVLGLAIGLIPIVHAFRIHLTTLLRAEGRAGTSTRRARIFRSVLVTVQVAFALILLVGAGLLAASFRAVLGIKPGFVTEGVWTGTIALPSVRYKEEDKQREFMQRALDHIRSIPGVVGAGATNTIPMGNNESDSVIFAEGYVMQPGESVISPQQIVVTPGYFETLGIPLREGRLFDSRDTEKSLKVLVIDEQLAKKFWPNTSPIGKRMWQPGDANEVTHPGPRTQWYTVVGVVGNVKTRGLVNTDARLGTYYYPYAQNADSVMTFAVRTGIPAQTLTPAIQTAISRLDPELPVYDVRTLQERLDESLITRKSPMLMALGFAIVALMLAGLGIYGVLAYVVSQRSREIGIRMALGGTAQRIFQMVLREGLLIIGIGMAVGIGGAVGLRRFLQSQLYGVQPMNPEVLASVLVILLAVGFFACALPARRATRVNPVVALREE
ncbi:MAG: ABC transporter permease [Acidobacteriia bacterium]|nr:ABC transporter permease [Terriglobia bacterium]